MIPSAHIITILPSMFFLSIVAWTVPIGAVDDQIPKTKMVLHPEEESKTDKMDVSRLEESKDSICSNRKKRLDKKNDKKVQRFTKPQDRSILAQGGDTKDTILAKKVQRFAKPQDRNILAQGGDTKDTILANPSHPTPSILEGPVSLGTRSTARPRRPSLMDYDLLAAVLDEIEAEANRSSHH